MARAAVGLLLASAVAITAGRTRLLSASGVAAAIVSGTACAAAGWSWAAMLVAFFLVSSALTQVGSHRKRAAERIVEKGGVRDAVQVLANGGVFAGAALLSLIAPWDGWMAVGAGALAAAAGDTWATEIGMLASRQPVSILTRRPIPTGTSGGVTLLGTIGGIGGAAFIAVLCQAGQWPSAVVVGGFAGGVAGMFADSLLGATLQARRWCGACSAATERLLHTCGGTTEPAGGLRWLDNDGVNFAATIAGAGVALMAAGMLSAG